MKAGIILSTLLGLLALPVVSCTPPVPPSALQGISEQELTENCWVMVPYCRLTILHRLTDITTNHDKDINITITEAKKLYKKYGCHEAQISGQVFFVHVEGIKKGK